MSYPRLKIPTINKKLRRACEILKIDVPISCYSFKRNGITHARLNGESDIRIQHKAGWSSSRQLKVYDQSTQRDSADREAVRRGLKKAKGSEEIKLEDVKTCPLCKTINKPTNRNCAKCSRPLDSEALSEDLKRMEMLKSLLDEKTLEKMSSLFK